MDGPDGAFGIVSGDFNGDGNPDLAVANSSSSVVSILLGNGDGTFQKAITVDLHGGGVLTGIVVGDFNHDNKLDLAVANSSTSDVSILLGNGDGTFQDAKTVSLDGPDGMPKSPPGTSTTMAISIWP